MTDENTTIKDPGTDDDVGKIKRDETKQVDYLAVCTFMHLISDANMSLRNFYEALEEARAVMLDPDCDGIIVTTTSKALFAKSMVDNFLCKP